MARRVRDRGLDTREARTRLEVRGKPHYRLMDKGLHLGYRRLRNAPGSWVARIYIGQQSYEVKRLGTADDSSDANGIDVLNFSQAQNEARKERDRHAGGGWRGPITVGDVMERYLRGIEVERGNADDARCRYEAFIKPHFGDLEVSGLTTERIRNWRNQLSQEPARARTRKGDQQRYRKTKNDADARRRRQSSVNRTLAMFKAALNKAWEDDVLPDNAVWMRVKLFEGVSASRARFLKVEEAKRLLNACDPYFRLLVQAALQTGARYGKLTQLRVADFNPDTGRVLIATSAANKKGADAVLSDEGKAFFGRVCIGRAGDELMFTKADGAPWGKGHQIRPIKLACKAAHIAPAISFHILRHTWASLAIMHGMPMFLVAKNLGHRDTRMVEKHYGHIEQDYQTQMIREHSPKFGFKPDRKVVAM
jgi:integrase